MYTCLPSTGPPSGPVLVYASGVVWSTGSGGLYGIVAMPHNSQYDAAYDLNGGYHYQTDLDRQGYTRLGYNREGRDRDGYANEGYDLFGYDRGGFDRRGYNKERRDRNGTLRPRTVEDAAKSLDDGADPINNDHLASLYSQIASALRGQKRTVVFGDDGSGFATDMQGTIHADPYPLGRKAPDAHNLMVIKGGIYHEIAHDQFTPPEVWAAVLEIAKSPVPIEGLDAGRSLLPTMYNIIEDGGIERRLSAQYAGVAEVLAASCALQPRWGERVGPAVSTSDQVIGALLYTALLFYRVSDEVRAAMTPEARTLFEELEPVVAAAVCGTPDDRFAAAVLVTRRFEDEGLLTRPPSDVKTTPPPPPGTQLRQPQSGQQQGQQGGQQGSGSQEGQAGGQGQPGGQAGQPASGGQPAPAPGDESGAGAGSGWRAADDDEPTGRPRSSGTADEEPPGPGRRPAAPDEPPTGRQPGSGDDAGDGQGSQGGQGNQDGQGGQGNQGGQGAGQDGGSGEPSGADPQQTRASPNAGSTTGSISAGDGGSALRDVEQSFSDADIAAIIAATEREAASAIDAGVRAGFTVTGMGAPLHRPLGNADAATQRYRTPEGRAETVPVALPRTDDAQRLGELARRRPTHQKIASDLARQLKAVREETDKIVRFKREGWLDRRRAIAAIKGAQDVNKQCQPVPETRFAALISVDLSGSMAGQIRALCPNGPRCWPRAIAAVRIWPTPPG